MIDAVGTVFMATGRSRALLGFGVAHFVVYIAVVLVASRWGVTGVAIAASGVHLAFVVVAYQMLLHGRTEKTLRFLWQDVSAAVVSCAAMAAAAGRSRWRSSGAGAPASRARGRSSAPWAAVVYLAALRLWFAGRVERPLRPLRRVRAVPPRLRAKVPAFGARR